MTIFVAFLRGMNVGKKRIRNDQLCACFEEMGFETVSAFLASGNVIFSSNKRSVAKIETEIRTGLEALLNYPVPTFVRSATQIEQLAEATPYSAEQLEDTKENIQVVLLEQSPDTATKQAALGLVSKEDQLVFEGTEMYWLPKAGLSDSELKMSTLEKTVGPMTVRTQRTFQRLLPRLS